MSGRVFVAADYHFDQKSILTFKRRDGVTPLRPFSCVEEMNDEIVRRNNEVVGKEDHLYVIGDVAMKKSGLRHVSRLNGRKRLVGGNHDQEHTKDYIAAGFQEVKGCRVFLPNEQQGYPGGFLTHVPIHAQCMKPNFLNVHGHLHSNQVMRLATSWPSGDIIEVPDIRYVCVSVEWTNYYPIPLDRILQGKWTPCLDN